MNKKSWLSFWFFFFSSSQKNELNKNEAVLDSHTPCVPSTFLTRYLQYLNEDRVIVTGLENPLLPGHSKSAWDNCMQLFNC